MSYISLFLKYLHLCCVLYIEQKSKRSNQTSNDDEDDSDNNKVEVDNSIDDDEDDSKLLSVSACNNTLNLVMRDPGTTLKIIFRDTVLETVYWFQKPYIGIIDINIML